MQVTNDMSLFTLISHASVPVQLIMLLLVAGSLVSWVIIFRKQAQMRRAHALNLGSGLAGLGQAAQVIPP